MGSRFTKCTYQRVVIKMAITYTQTRLNVMCYPEEIIVGKRDEREEVLYTQENFDDPDFFVPDGVAVGDVMFSAITADEATAGLTVAAGQFMTHIDVEYTGTDNATGETATCETKIPLTHWDDIVEADFTAFADVTEAWVQAKVLEWYNNFEVEVDIPRKIFELNSGPLSVANPWD